MAFTDSYVMNQFFLNKTSNQKAKLDQFTVLESKHHVSTSFVLLLWETRGKCHPQLNKSDWKSPFSALYSALCFLVPYGVWSLVTLKALKQSL